ncbi:MAG: hypothetical protein HY782_05460 [Chloroflexi bacterium]|nr:hypothetical protein [Chloroflexota bacterium]
MPTIAGHCILSPMGKPMVFLAILYSLFLVGCQGATETPPPAPAAQVLVIPVVATPVPSDTPRPTASPTAKVTSAASPTSSRTPTATRAPATPTRQRPTPTPVPTATPPDTLLDGNYTSIGNVRIQFTVSGGGSMASAGYFSFRCPADGALSTYGFTDPAAIVGGQFAFSALPASSGAPQVTMICTAITLTQARCTIRNLLATNKCLDTPATATRK